MKPLAPSSSGGVALVTTVIVIAVLAVVAVAFMQSTSTDRLSSRTVANYYKAQLAAEAGLADAMARLHEGVQGFTYISGSELQGDTYRTFIRSITGESGVWELDGSKIYLDSGPASDASAALVLAGTLDDPQLVRNAEWRPLTVDNPRPNESQRYAFWVDEAGSKQNLEWWGGGQQRGVITNLSNVPLVLPDATGRESGPFPPAALQEVLGLRAPQADVFLLDDAQFVGVRSGVNLPTVESFRLMVPGGLGEGFNRYHFTRHSASGATAPNGRRKLNLEALRQHVNNLSSEQGPESPKAQLVEQLLQDDPENAQAWGGGSLSWLAKTEKYTAAEQRQIVANIIDYLDDDLIPTTDSVDNPTYFGVEMRMDSSGLVQGHPMVNYLTVGLIFNRSANNTNSPTYGMINSTRVLCSIGLVYPWSSGATAAGAYEPEIQIVVEGDVANGLASLGTDAQGYFLPTLSVELNSRPTTAFAPFSGYNFPQAVGIAGNASYATRIYGHSQQDWPDRVPRDVQFSNVKFKVERFRLRYTPTGGGSPGYVFILPANLEIELEPSSFGPGIPQDSTGPPPFFVKISDAQFSQTKNLYFKSDPRTHFQSASWTNMVSEVPFGTQIPQPVVTDGDPFDVFSSASPDADGSQEVPSGFDWFTSTAMVNHLARFSREGMESIGEMGYIWTGKPWQTLNLQTVENPGTADWNLLDYVTAGRRIGSESDGLISAALPLRRVGQDSASSLTAALVEGGGFNINTRKAPTITAVVTNAPNLSEAAADILLNSESGAFASAYGQIANLIVESPGIVKTGQDTKFGKEAVQRALANVAVSQSRIFTIYSVGEYDSGSSVGRAQLEADVFVGVDPQDGNAIIQVINKRFK